jgi:hypothetical protein
MPSQPEALKPEALKPDLSSYSESTLYQIIIDILLDASTLSELDTEALSMINVELNRRDYEFET